MNFKNERNAGRHPKIDPIAFRCSVNFNAVEQVQLEAMHEKSGIESMSAFIKMQIFGKPMKVFYVDENSRIFIDMLSDLNDRYRKKSKLDHSGTYKVNEGTGCREL